MERLDFLIREAVRSPEMKLKVRAVFAENTALHEEVSQLKAEGKPYKVYMIAAANKFLRIYYARVKNCIESAAVSD